MGAIKEARHVLPFAGFIYVDSMVVDNIINKLNPYTGATMMRSEPVPFTYTKYYHKEMGTNLIRRWCVFETLIDPGMLADLKLHTNEIEQHYLNDKGGRMVNIDPGLLSMNNIVLASTKNYSHRIYLGKGIYAEITLIYKNKTYHPVDWTYPDYRESATIDFFTRARDAFKERYETS
jgi:hypothetical protein